MVAVGVPVNQQEPRSGGLSQMIQVSECFTAATCDPWNLTNDVHRSGLSFQCIMTSATN